MGDSLDALTLEVVASFGGRATPIKDGQSHVVLASAWHELPGLEVTRLFEMTEQVGVTLGAVNLATYQRAAIAFNHDPAFVDLVRIDVQREAERAASKIGPPKIANATLFPYQEQGSGFLRTLARMGVGSLLADEMGLGKTLQAITLIADCQGDGTSLVVCPSSLTTNWFRELTRFAPQLKVLVHAGPLRAGVSGTLENFDVVVASYDVVANDSIFMVDVHWNLVIVDEAQAIKNPESRRARILKSLPKRVGIAITGTPVENGLSDIWSIVEFVVPELAKQHQEAVVGRDRDLQEAVITGRAVAPVMLRRRVVDVGSQLPPKVEEHVALDMSEAERAMYESISSVGGGLAAIQARRQFCAVGDESRAPELVDASSKMEYILSTVRGLAEQGKKILIFTSFTRTVDRLVERIAGLPHVQLCAPVDGRTGPVERQAVIDHFESVVGSAVLVMNPRAAGVGLNITAANYVYHFNPEWNPAATDQATARAHRTGQRQTVFVTHLLYADSVEEGALEVSSEKREVAGAVEDAAAEATKEN
ncbi:DEAD/DEAH box helicase [Phycicoccus sonneratiae]|uniref:DEAD/DEAH box helicase n=1 Tax=Phycicoccus sonneratiae TaxID=2807628 RepID=A0ABS2CK71_9MICO|nr:DEAD/DEAH box helicase [Phycicoccus sonneraticus]MBM6400281.1 DEAD/DEAH box helicase [Phycicoccus sonneraticus]